MKIAVCFSGHTRTFKRTIESFNKHVVKNHDVSTFIHTWKNVSSGIGNIELTNNVDLNEVIDAYKPCLIKIEPQRQFSLQDHQIFQTNKRNPAIRRVIFIEISLQKNVNVVKVFSA